MKVRISIGPGGLANDPDEPAQLVADGYGAFISDTETGLVNYHPHVSAVVVVHERTNKQDWIEATIANERDPGGLEDVGAAMVGYMKTIRRLEEAGEAPDGSYRWVEIYDLSGNPTSPGFQGVPLTGGVFSGPRDRWYGFTDEGFGELD